jgi:hypothetical protein
MTEDKPVKIYWDNHATVCKELEYTGFVDYLVKRLSTNYIEINDELSKSYIFLNHNEYIFDKYLTYLFEYCQNNHEYNNKILFVKDKKDCDIIIVSVKEQGLLLENNITKNKIYFGIEHSIPIPYLTGTYSIVDKTPAFFSNNNDRKYLLAYVGGSWRGPKDKLGNSNRNNAIKGFHDLNSIKYSNRYEKIFHCPLLANSHSEETLLGWICGNFSVEAKKAYWDSVFSWHPYGDTPTRRAFYEAILLGNIPVISKSSYHIYKNLLIGKECIDDIAIVFDDKMMFNAEKVINYLLEIDNSQIFKRRNIIGKIFNRIQWNITSDTNALLDMFNKIRNT